MVDFQPYIEAHYRVLFNHYDNKDAAFAPDAIELPDGRVMLALFHRPVYMDGNAPQGIAHPVPSIWASCCDLEAVRRDLRNLCVMHSHILLVEPVNQWEALKVGLGTPPIRTRLGYMVVYHGVSGELAGTIREPHVNYDAGVLIFRREKDRLSRYRSTTPILIPEVQEETDGIVNNVVFPTGIDKRTEDSFDIYYGMADKYIGVARLWLPETLDHEEEGDLPFAKRLCL